MDPMFDDLIPASQAVAPHNAAVNFDDLVPARQAETSQDGAVNFDDLIPNRGEPWQPSSFDAGTAYSDQTVNNAIATGVGQQRPPRFIPNGPSITVTPVPPPQLNTALDKETLDLRPRDLPALRNFAPAEDGDSDALASHPGTGSASVFAPGGTGQISRALAALMMSGSKDAQLTLTSTSPSDSNWNMLMRAYRAPDGVVTSALGDTPGNGTAQFGDHGYVPGSFTPFGQATRANSRPAPPPTFISPTIVARGNTNNFALNPYSNVSPLQPDDLNSIQHPFNTDTSIDDAHLGLGVTSFAPGAIGSTSSTIDAGLYLGQALYDLAKNNPEAAEQHALAGMISAGAAIGGLAFDSGALKAGLDGLFGAERFAPVLAGAEAAAQAGQSGAKVIRYSAAGARGGVTILNAEANGGGRRPWPQSEADAGTNLGPGHNGQHSLLHGEPVRYGTRDSVRPDWVAADNSASFEVKNYDVAKNSTGLINKVARQAIQRVNHLPSGMRQRVIIDIRGQHVTPAQEDAIIKGITNKSGGIILPDTIHFMR